jgi:hypothetical protein
LWVISDILGAWCGRPAVGAWVGDGVDGGADAVYGVGGDGGLEGGLVAFSVVGDGQVERVVQGALQVVGCSGEVEPELG